MMTGAKPCQGVTGIGRPCRRRTRNQNGLCGRCAGFGLLGGFAQGAAAGAPDDPFDESRVLLSGLGRVAPRPKREPRAKVRRLGVPSAAAMTVVHWFEGGWGDEFAQYAAEGRYGPPTRMLLRLLARGSYGPTLAAVAADQRTPARTLRRIAESYPDNVEAVDNVAKNPNSPPDVLGRLAGSENRFFRADVAANPRTETWILGCLAGDPDARVAVNAINNPGCPDDRVDAATNDHRVMVAAAAARRTTSEPGVLRLSRHRYPEVRAAAAARSADPGTLARLAADADPMVRQAALANPACPAAGKAAAGLLAG